MTLAPPTHLATSHERRPRGFTLLEVIIAIAVMAILLAALAPLVVRSVNAPREDDTLRKLRALGSAIVPTSDLPAPGYVATVGRVPASIADLNLRPAAIPAGAAGSNGVPIGWVGPYATLPVPQPTQDAWGTPFQLDLEVVAGVATGGWRLRGAGPDRAFNTADDFLVPPVYVRSTGTMRVELLKDLGTGLSNLSTTDVASVALFYPVNGVETSVNGTLVTSPNVYAFQAAGADVQLPLGTHAVRVTLSATAGCAGCVFWRNVTLSRATNTARVAVSFAAAAGKTFCCGVTGPPGWVNSPTGNGALRMVINGAACGFATTPVWTAVLQSPDNNSTQYATGMTAIINPTAAGFSVDVSNIFLNPTPPNAVTLGWAIGWCGFPR